MGVWRGCEVPEDLLYDVERDVWVRLEADGSATCGMTDPAQTRCGKVVSIRFKPVGRRVAWGQSLATIESAKWVGPFPAVLSGEIAATNEGEQGPVRGGVAGPAPPHRPGGRAGRAAHPGGGPPPLPGPD